MRRRHDRRGHRDACRWAVLGDGAGGNVDVQVLLRQKIRRNPELGGALPDVAESGAGRSCITLPNWPVSVRWPLPGISDASMKSTSPPASVHATLSPRPAVRSGMRSPIRSAAAPGTRRSHASLMAVCSGSDATRAATLRAMVPIWRSSDRTGLAVLRNDPPQRVVRNLDLAASSPFSSICRGTR